MTATVAPPAPPSAPAVGADEAAADLRLLAPPTLATEGGAAAEAPEPGRAPPPALGRTLDLVRAVLVVMFVLAGGLLAQVTFVGSIQQRSEQQRLYDSFRAELALGTAPTGPLDGEGRAHPIGSAVAYLEIPDLGVQQVVVSGTTSSALFAGPGHRRDSVLPGQAGASVIMGRGAAYGAPLASIDDLDAGDEIRVTTGQGEFEFSVIGTRHEGDPLPPPPDADESRLVLVTADGSPFLPGGVLRVDATMAEAVGGAGSLFTTEGLPAAERPMAGDTSQLGAVALWLQVLIVVVLAGVWSWKRWGRAQSWVVFLPPLVLLGSVVANHTARLLPNLV